MSTLTLIPKNKYNKYMKITLITLLTLSLLLTPIITYAAPTFSFDGDNRIGKALDVPDEDPETITLSFLQWFFGALGLISVVIILYGGFSWMTAAGNEEKLSRAKKIITYAVIGMMVMLTAFILVSTVFKTGANVSGLYSP